MVNEKPDIIVIAEFIGILLIIGLELFLFVAMIQEYQFDKARWEGRHSGGDISPELLELFEPSNSTILYQKSEAKKLLIKKKELGLE